MSCGDEQYPNDGKDHSAYYRLYHDKPGNDPTLVQPVNPLGPLVPMPTPASQNKEAELSKKFSLPSLSSTGAKPIEPVGPVGMTHGVVQMVRLDAGAVRGSEG